MKLTAQLFLSVLLLALLTACAIGPGPTGPLQVCGPSQVTNETTAAVGIGTYPTAQGGKRLAQSFTTSSGSIPNFAAVNLLLSRVGTPDNTSITVSIARNTGSSTAGYPVSSSPISAGSLAVNTTSSVISTTPQQYLIALSPTVTLAASTVYWIILSAGYDVNTTDYIAWSATDNGAFVGGRALLDRVQPNQGWSDPQTSTGGGAKDFVFQLICPTPSPSPT